MLPPTSNVPATFAKPLAITLPVILTLAPVVTPPPMTAEPDELIVENTPAHLASVKPNVLPLAVGTKFVSISPVTDIVSVFAFPKSTLPFNVVAPSTFNVVSRSTAPVEFNPPTFAYVAAKFAVIEASPVIVVLPIAAVVPTVNVPVVDIPVDVNLEFAPVLPTAIVLLANLTIVFAFEPT